MTLLIVLAVAGLGVVLIVVGLVMWFSRWYVNRYYRNRPTVRRSRRGGSR